jgi:hypothetical protein
VRDEYEQFINHISAGRYFVEPGFITAEAGGQFDQRISNPEFFPWGVGKSTTFPFDAKPTDIDFKMKIYISTEADQIKLPLIGPLPRFYGRLNLRPIEKSYSIVSD